VHLVFEPPLPPLPPLPQPLVEGTTGAVGSSQLHAGFAGSSQVFTFSVLHSTFSSLHVVTGLQVSLGFVSHLGTGAVVHFFGSTTLHFFTGSTLHLGSGLVSGQGQELVVVGFTGAVPPPVHPPLPFETPPPGHLMVMVVIVSAYPV